MGDFDNDGAMMDVDETLMCKFIKVKPQQKPNGVNKKGPAGWAGGRGAAGRGFKRGNLKGGYGIF